jgi:hypothetical protein
MPDAVTTQTLFDDGGHFHIHLTNVSDGTGEAAAIKVDVSTLVGAPTDVAIEKIAWATVGMGFNLLWDATADVLFFTCGNTTSAGQMDFTKAGSGPRSPGIVNNAGAGKTGDVMLTTVGHTAGDSYVVDIWGRVRAT